MLRTGLTVLLLALITGCANPQELFRLEEYGQGWRLKIEEGEGESFRASWVGGDNRSMKLVNYHDADTGGFIVINMLYLEVDAQGNVVNGRLKRFAIPEWSKRLNYERGAKWFNVLSGRVQLDAEFNGELQVKCQGYEFNGRIIPDENLKVIKPKS